MNTEERIFLWYKQKKTTNLNLLSGRTDQFILYSGHGASYLYISLRFGVVLWTAIDNPRCKGSATYTEIIILSLHIATKIKVNQIYIQWAVNQTCITIWYTMPEKLGRIYTFSNYTRFGIFVDLWNLSLIQDLPKLINIIFHIWHIMYSVFVHK